MFLKITSAHNIQVLEITDLIKSPAWHNPELPSGTLTINENHRIHSSPWLCRAVPLLMLLSMDYKWLPWTSVIVCASFPTWILAFFSFSSYLILPSNPCCFSFHMKSVHTTGHLSSTFSFQLGLGFSLAPPSQS